LNNPKRYIVTAALPYANGPVHIGHVAGCYLPADIYVRYQRLHRRDLIFVCGSDEHGVPITIKAKNEGIEPQQVVDKYHAMMKKAFADFGIGFDIYDRTSNPIHHQTASDFFKALYEKGVFSEETTAQYYDEEAKQFLADRYILGTCPKCGNTDAYGDQCEKCGSSLSPTELIDPRSSLSGAKPVLKATRNWFLPLDKMQPELEKYIESHKADWKTNVFGQCKSWLKQGLQGRAMTRDLDWGVKVPLEGANGKVLYVWFDAPIGYISATKVLLPDEWQKYWQDKETKLIHFIGKDNIVFHSIIFPAMLQAHGDFILPENIPANEFLNLEGDKISTSRNWAVWLHEYLDELPDRRDELRYVLTSIAPETSDSEFTWKDYQARVNNELVAILGNFVNRVVVLMHKYYDGKVECADQLKIEDSKVNQAIGKTYDALEQHLETYKFRQAQFEVMDLARFGNKYLTDHEPWKTIKTSPEEAKTVLHDCLQLIAHLGACLQPFLPDTASRIFDMLNIKAEYAWSDEIIFENGHQLQTARLLFSKIEDEIIDLQIEKLKSNKAAAPAHVLAAQKPACSFDDFQKMDIRVATILEAVKVPKADKLLQLLVDTGLDKRTVVSGIAEHFKPEDIIGQKVCILMNLEPRKIRGIDSQGMILLAEDEAGKLYFVSPQANIINGAEVR